MSRIVAFAVVLALLPGLAEAAKKEKKQATVTQSGHQWHLAPESAALAAGDEKPIVWFRHVGELRGPMCSASHRMRVVSFADRDVQKTLGDDFVLLSTNMEGKLGAGKSVGHLPKDAPGLCPSRLAHQNCQVYFLTSKLEIFHVATGFLSPKDLCDEIEFAGKVFAAIQKEPKKARETVIAMHRERLTALGYKEKELAPPEGLDKLITGATGLPFSVAAGEGADVFAGIARARVLRDHQYMLESPLISQREFERDPSALIGRAEFVFQSGPASGRPTGR